MTGGMMRYECIKTGDEHPVIVPVDSIEQLAIASALAEGGYGYCGACMTASVTEAQLVDGYDEAREG
jgi:hypothetical protein